MSINSKSQHTDIGRKMTPYKDACDQRIKNNFDGKKHRSQRHLVCLTQRTNCNLNFRCSNKC